MVVDDDRVLRRLTATALSYCVNREVLQFENGSAAWNYIIQGGHIDIVLSDVNMPDLDGFQLLSRIKEKDPHISVVIMSGLVENEELSRMHGADAFLAKPFEINDLFGLVQSFVVEAPPKPIN